MGNNNNSDKAKINNQRLIDLLVTKHKLLTEEELNNISAFGFIYLINILYFICEKIEENGFTNTGKKLTQFTFDAYYNTIEAEFYCKFNSWNIIANISGGLEENFPFELAKFYTIGKKALEKLQDQTLYPPEELEDSILNQKQLVYLFSALSNEEIFIKSPELLSDALSTITAYSKNSIKKNFNLNSSSNGGMNKKDKDKIIEELKRIIENF
jgi:hypothetical protein